MDFLCRRKSIVACATICFFIVTQALPASAQGALPNGTITVHMETADAGRQLNEALQNEKMMQIVRMIVDDRVPVPEISAALKRDAGISISGKQADDFALLVAGTRRDFSYLLKEQDKKDKKPVRAYDVGSFNEKEYTRVRAILAGRITSFCQRVMEEQNAAAEQSEVNKKISEQRPLAPVPIKKIKKKNPHLMPPSVIKKSTAPSVYRDPEQSFAGIDIDHFVVAVQRLQHGALPPESIDALVGGGFLPRELAAAGDKAVKEHLYHVFVSGGATADLVQALLQGSYADPRFDDVTVETQHTNPRGQGVLEGISNSLDALGLEIGRFGKGVKQITSWLGSSGIDRIDVWTRAENAPVKTWYHLTILEGINGQKYIQIVTESYEDKTALLAKNDITVNDEAKTGEHGTILSIRVRQPISVTETERAALNTDRKPEDVIENSQESIVESAKTRFAYVDDARIVTQYGDTAPVAINGYEHKKTIVGPPLHHAAVSAGTVTLTLDDRHIVLTDDGKGMDAKQSSCMFVPEEGDKRQPALTEEAADRECREKVRVVHDTTLPHRISFARQKEVVVFKDIPAAINPAATVPGGLMLEFGRLVEVPESRDRIDMSAPYFTKAVMYMIDEIVASTALSDEEKCRYINTIIVGSDAYAAGNTDNEHAAQTVRLYAKKALAPVLAALRENGVIVLPHDRAYARLAIPEGKHTVYLHQDLLGGNEMASLRALDPVVVPGIILEGGRRLVLVPFTDKSIAHVAPFDPAWYRLPEDERVPMIKTDTFIILPRQLGEHLYQLACKRAADPKSLSFEEERDFYSESQAVNIITAQKVITSYEIVPQEKALSFDDLITSTVDDDELDSAPIEKFLTKPPVEIQQQKKRIPLPSDAQQRFVLLSDGSVRSVATGEKVLHDISVFRYLGGKRYYIVHSETAWHENIRRMLERHHDDLKEEMIKKITDPFSADFYQDLMFTLNNYMLTSKDEKMPNGLRDKIYPMLCELWPEEIRAHGESVYEENAAGELVEIVNAGTEKSTLEFSPDKRFVFIREQNGEIRSCVDLATRKRHYLNAVFSSTPSMAPVPYPQHIAFSHDGKYVLYVVRNATDNTQKVIAVDLARQKATPMSDTVEPHVDVSLHVSPFAPIVCVEMKDAAGADNMLFNIEDGDYIVHCDFFRTDPTGTYTAIIENGKMSIFVHNGPERGLYTAANLGLHGDIISVNLVAHLPDVENAAPVSGKALLSANDTEGGYRDIVVDEGNVLTHKRYVQADTFAVGGEFSIVYKNEKGEQQTLRGRQHDPYQQLERGIYVHLQFPLVIDNTDPNDPRAVSLRTGNSYPARGEVVFLGNNPWFDTETIITRDPQGTFGANTLHVQLSSSYQEEDFRKEIFGSYAGDGRTLVLREGDGTAPRYVIYYLKEEFGKKLELELPIDPAAYTELSFDGTYYVFVNPKTGAVVYLDPEKSGEPYFVAPDVEKTKEKPLLGKMTVFPTDRGIINKKGNKYYVHDSTGANVDNNNEIMGEINRLNKNTVAVETGSLNSIVDVEKKGPSHYDIHYNQDAAFFNTKRGERVLQTSDRFVLVQKYDDDGNGYIAVFDTQRKFVDGLEALARNKSIRKAEISASGRFVVYEDPSGRLHYYDGETGEFFTINDSLFDGGKWQVHDRADAVMVKRGDADLYGSFILQNKHIASVSDPDLAVLGSSPRELFNHIEIDSTGTFMTLHWGNSIFVQPLRGDMTKTYKATSCAVGTSDNYVFCILYNAEGTVIKWLVRDKRTGAVVDLPHPAHECLAAKPLLEVFTENEKYIARSSNRNNTIVNVSYTASQPVEPMVTARIDGRVITIERTKGRERIIKIEFPQKISGPGAGSSTSGPANVPLRESKWAVSVDNGTRRIPLAGNRVEAFARSDGTYIVYTINDTPSSKQFQCDDLLATDNRQWFACREKDTGTWYLINAAGERRECAPFLPEGYEITDVYENVFVVSDRRTGEVYALDPVQVEERSSVKDTNGETQIPTKGSGSIEDTLPHINGSWEKVDADKEGLAKVLRGKFGGVYIRAVFNYQDTEGRLHVVAGYARGQVVEVMRTDTGWEVIYCQDAKDGTPDSDRDGNMAHILDKAFRNDNVRTFFKYTNHDGKIRVFVAYWGGSLLEVEREAAGWEVVYCKRSKRVPDADRPDSIGHCIKDFADSNSIFTAQQYQSAAGEERVMFGYFEGKTIELRKTDNGWEYVYAGKPRSSDGAGSLAALLDGKFGTDAIFSSFSYTDSAGNERRVFGYRKGHAVELVLKNGMWDFVFLKGALDGTPDVNRGESLAQLLDCAFEDQHIRPIFGFVDAEGNLRVVAESWLGRVLEAVYANGRWYLAYYFNGSAKKLKDRKYSPVLAPSIDNGYSDLLTFVYEGSDGMYHVVFFNLENGVYVAMECKALKMKPPEKMIVPETGIGTKDEEIIEFWKQDVLSHRDEWVTDAREAYHALFDAVPEDYRAQVKNACRELISSLYNAEDKAVREQFAQSLEEKQGTIIWPGTMPIPAFQKTIARVVPHLTKYIAALDDGFYLSREKAGLQQAVYRDLVTSIFSAALNTAVFLPDSIQELMARFRVNEDAVYAALFDAYLYGWGMKTTDDADMAVRIGLLVRDMKRALNNDVTLQNIRKIVTFLNRVTDGDKERTAILVRQLHKLASRGPAAERRALKGWYTSFEKVALDTLVAVAKKQTVNDYIGNARGFIMFLTMDVDFVRDETAEMNAHFLPQGDDVTLPAGGISLSQLIQLEKTRPKKNEQDIVMSMDYLLDAVRRNMLPQPDEKMEEALIRESVVQREPGAHTAECAQNAFDAGATQLTVDYYLHNNENEYVEEIRDNGSGALQEVAMLIPKSTKAAGEQIDQVGFFGTGKYTIFKDVDRVEIMSKNTEGRAFMFVFDVSRNAAGVTTSITLSRIRRIHDGGVAQGVTVRRIMKVKTAIPELEYMLSSRAWKTFTGLANTDNFHIQLVNYEGKPEPVRTPEEGQVLSEVVFKPFRSEKVAQPFFRLWQTKDMPEQTVNMMGLRITNTPDDYFALVPPQLRKYIHQWGLNIQFPPLPVIRGRSGFKHEARYLQEIQKYVALEVYKVLVKKALTDERFTFEGFPMDWERRLAYLDKYDEHDPWLRSMMAMAAAADTNDYDNVSYNDLKSLVPREGVFDTRQAYVMFMLRLKVMLNGRPVSLIDRLLEIQAIVDAHKVRQQEQRFADMGYTRSSMTKDEIPQYERHVANAQHEADKEKIDLRDFLIPFEQLSASEAYLYEFAQFVAQQFPEYKIEEVHIVRSDYPAGGAFVTNSITGRRMLLLNQSVAEQIRNGEMADTVIHELGHLLEAAMYHNVAEDGLFWKNGFATEKMHFTHQQEGPFAAAMKEVALVYLVAVNKVRVERSHVQGPVFQVTEAMIQAVVDEHCAPKSKTAVVHDRTVEKGREILRAA